MELVRKIAAQLFAPQQNVKVFYAAPPCRKWDRALPLPSLGRTLETINMAEYILCMHADATTEDSAWAPYIAKLRESRSFEGGSAIGDGLCARKIGVPAPLTAHLTGYIRLRAESLEHARSLLSGNPHFESGGTVEIREPPRTDRKAMP